MTTPPASTSGFRLLSLWWIALLTTGAWLLSFGIIYTDSRASGWADFDPRVPLVNEITGAYTAGLLCFVIIWFWSRYPLVAPHRLRRLPLYLLMVVCIGLAHTTLMNLVRVPLYAWFGLGEYRTGDLFYRYLFEFQKQFVWIWFVVGWIAWSQHRRESQEAKLRTARLAEQLQRSQLDTIKQQINPHFLFNSLNMISEKVYESPEEADRLISELSELLRSSLEMGRADEVPLSTEIEFVERYLSIMHARFEDRLQYNLEIAPEVHAALVPPLILQPILENSIKHRLDAGPGAVSIQMIAQTEGDRLKITIADKSPHPLSDAPSSKPKSGTGMRSLSLRLKTHFGEQAQLAYGPRSPYEYSSALSLPLRFSSAQNNDSHPHR